MGNSVSSTTSTRLLETPLTPQPRFPRVINTRFVPSRTTTVRVPEGFWSHDHDQPLEITDADTSEVLFKINPRSSDRAKPQQLLDKNGVPVVSMSGYPIAPSCAMYVPLPAALGVSAADRSSLAWLESRALCYLETNLRPLEKRLVLTLEDPVTRDKLNIRVEGSWHTHEALFFAHRGSKVDRVCIARVYLEPDVYQAMKARKKEEKLKKKHKKSDGVGEGGDETTTSTAPPRLSYSVDIAPGVDVALIVLACAALEEEQRKKDDHVEIEVGTDEITTALAQRYHYFQARDTSQQARDGKTMFYVSDYQPPPTSTAFGG